MESRRHQTQDLPDPVPFSSFESAPSCSWLSGQKPELLAPPFPPVPRHLLKHGFLFSNLQTLSGSINSSTSLRLPSRCHLLPELLPPPPSQSPCVLSCSSAALSPASVIMSPSPTALPGEPSVAPPLSIRPASSCAYEALQVRPGPCQPLPLDSVPLPQPHQPVGHALTFLVHPVSSAPKCGSI